MHAKILPYSISEPSLVLIAQVIFFYRMDKYTHSHRRYWSPYPHIGYCWWR